MRSLSVPTVCVFGAILAGALPLPAPQVAGLSAQEGPPTFRSSVTLVQMDAFVTDANGVPVTGLTADDFEIRERGEPRDIVTFAETNLAMPPAGGIPPALAEPDVASNEHPALRRYFIALDEVAPERALRARHILRKFLTEQIGATDVVAIGLTGRGPANSGQDFTRNTRLLLGALERFTGGFPSDLPTDGGTMSIGASPVTSSRARQISASLRALTESLAAMPGRKVVILVTEALGGTKPDETIGLNAYAVTDYRGGAMTPAENDFHAAIAAATRGNVTIYPIDPRGLDPDGGGLHSMEIRADLAALADVTGGFSLANSNSFETAFARIVRENSSHYTIGFASEYTRRDGRFVTVDVRVRRPGLEVRARNGYVAPLGSDRLPSPPAAGARMTSVTEALRSPIAVGGLTMRAVATPFRGGGRNAAVATILEFDVSALDLAEGENERSGDLEIAYVVTDATGRRRAGQRHKASVSISHGAVERAFTSGLRASWPLDLAPGRYQLRIALGDHVRAGSVLYDLEVPDFRKAPVALSGLALSSTGAPADTTLAIDDLLEDALSGGASARREFGSAETLELYVEVYENAKKSPAAVVAVDLRDAAGRVVRQFPDLKTTRLLRGNDPGRGIRTAAPLADLPEGEYVLHVEATAGRERAIRQVPIRVR
jgi:VWFA-related protein